MQIYFNVNSHPAPAALFWRYSAEKKLAGIHQSWKYRIIISWNISDFHSVNGLNHNRSFIVFIVGLSEKVKFVVLVQMRHELEHVLEQYNELIEIYKQTIDEMLRWEYEWFNNYRNGRFDEPAP